MTPPSDPRKAPKLTIGVLYGFRALMVLLVCNYHIWQLGWLPQYFTIFGANLDLDFITRSSYLFVDGMLLMSGLLLYLPYALEKAEGAPVPSLGRFYANRLIRILPSYLLSILAILFFVALPQSKYGNGDALAKDVVTHLTFTFNFWPDTYLSTPLNGALWTVAVEMQFYLIFPFLARAAQKRPITTLAGMMLVGLGYRVLVLTSLPNKALLINQMIGFMDVYALGMLGAMLHVRWQRGAPEEETGQALEKTPWAKGGAALVFVLALWGIGALLRHQSTQSLQGVAMLRNSQLMIRFPFAVVMLCAMLGAAMMPRLLQKLLDNRLMRFLALISFNLYVWHQPLSALMAKGWFPKTLHSDLPLQRAYTLLCLCVALVAAMAATYGVELPLAKHAHHLIEKYRRNKAHEGPKTDYAQQTTDPVFLPANQRAEGVD